MKPTYGFAPAFDPSRADPAHNNTAPLARWVEGAGWGGLTAWRRVPVVLKVTLCMGCTIILVLTTCNVLCSCYLLLCAVQVLYVSRPGRHVTLRRGM